MLMTNEALSRCLPRVEQVTVSNASHLVHSMNPKAYNDALLSFSGQALERPSDQIRRSARDEVSTLVIS
jgi:hypothetical protein